MRITEATKCPNEVQRRERAMIAAARIAKSMTKQGAADRLGSSLTKAVDIVRGLA